MVILLSAVVLVLYRVLQAYFVWLEDYSFMGAIR